MEIFSGRNLVINDYCYKTFMLNIYSKGTTWTFFFLGKIWVVPRATCVVTPLVHSQYLWEIELIWFSVAPTMRVPIEQSMTPNNASHSTNLHDKDRCTIPPAKTLSLSLCLSLSLSLSLSVSLFILILSIIDNFFASQWNKFLPMWQRSSPYMMYYVRPCGSICAHSAQISTHALWYLTTTANSYWLFNNRCLTFAPQESRTTVLRAGGLWKKSLMREVILAVVFSAMLRSLFCGERERVNRWNLSKPFVESYISEL